MIKQFDLHPNAAAHPNLDVLEPDLQGDESLDYAAEYMRGPAGDIDLQDGDPGAAECLNKEVNEVEEENDDNVEGWTDEIKLLSPGEHERVCIDIRPVNMVLVKVRSEKRLALRAYQFS
jgi:hypothetical protein